MANKVKSLLGGPGFYAVLALCVLAVGVGGYFLLFGEPAQTEAPTGPDTAASAPVEDLPEHEPVVETVPPEEPEEETEPVVMPEVTIPVDDTPVVAEEPHVVVLPIQGEVLTAFSVDQLLYNETLDDWRTHDGVDIAAAEGDAVLAACAVTVSSITDDPLMGTTVVIQHSGIQRPPAHFRVSLPRRRRHGVRRADHRRSGNHRRGGGRPGRPPALLRLWYDGEAVDPIALTADAAAAETGLCRSAAAFLWSHAARLPIRSATARMVRRRKIALSTRDTSSEMGKASHTSVRTPVWDNSHATGSSTTSWRHTEVIRLYSGLPIA